MSWNLVCFNPGPPNWISIGPGFNLGACKWEATPMRWVNEQSDWLKAGATEFLVCTMPCLRFWWQIAFFNQHGCTTNAANTKYNSRAAQLYREKIKTLATQATRRHGTDVTFPYLFLVLCFSFLTNFTWMCANRLVTFTALLICSCGSTVKVLFLRQPPNPSRWISLVCIQRYVV